PLRSAGTIYLSTRDGSGRGLPSCRGTWPSESPIGTGRPFSGRCCRPGRKSSTDHETRPGRPARRERSGKGRVSFRYTTNSETTAGRAMKRALWTAGIAAALVGALHDSPAQQFSGVLLSFSDAERRAILSHGPWPIPPERDPSNRVSGRPEAVAFGE